MQAINALFLTGFVSQIDRVHVLNCIQTGGLKCFYEGKHRMKFWSLYSFLFHLGFLFQKYSILVFPKDNFRTQSIVCPSVKNQSDTVTSPQRPTIQLKRLCVFVFCVDNTALVTSTFSHFKSISIRNFSWHTVKLDLALMSSLHQPDILTTCLPLIRFTYILTSNNQY